MASQQPPRAWLRLASMRQPPPPPPAPAPAPTPQPDPVLPPRPVMRPAFSQTFRAPLPQPQEPTPPPPQPPAAVAPPPPPPVTAPPPPPPAVVTPEPAPQRPARFSPPPPPPPAATKSPPSPAAPRPPATTTSSVPTSPIIRTSVPSSSLPNSPPANVQYISSSSVPQSPKTKVSAPSSSLPSSPTLKPATNGPLAPSNSSPKPKFSGPSSSLPSSPAPKLASSSPLAPPASPTTITARSPNPTPSPKTTTLHANTPSPSPKTRHISHPLSPLTLPPAQLRSDNEREPKIPQEAEQKTVLVQETIEKPKSTTKTFNNGQQKYVDDTRSTSFGKKGNREVTKDKGTYDKYSDSEDSGMRVITIAGENKGAIMELSPLRKNKGNLRAWSDGENSAKGHNDHKAPMNAIMNSNVQGVNNSVLFNASCTHNDPGVHLSLSRNGNGGRGIHMKDKVIKD